MSRTTCKLIGEDVVYKHVQVYTRDRSVNRLLMRRAVLRNKIMAFCMRGRDHNKCVRPHLFSGPWMVDARGGGGRYNVYVGFENLYRCTPPACVTRHFLPASKMTKASSFFRHCLFVFGRQMIYRQRINAGPWNMSCTTLGLFCPNIV